MTTRKPHVHELAMGPVEGHIVYSPDEHNPMQWICVELHVRDKKGKKRTIVFDLKDYDFENTRDDL